MSKYDKFGEYLDERGESPVTLTFRQVEEVLGFRLPAGAYKHRAWWRNSKRPGGLPATSWLPRGWRSGNVNLGERRVTFWKNGKNGNAYDSRSRSKYDPLGERLANQAASPVTMTFQEIAEMLGVPLPRSAYDYHSWWANDDRPGKQSRIWLSRGWRAGNVDLRGRQVTFRRDDSAGSAKPGQRKRALAAASWLHNKTGKYSKLGDHLDKQTASPLTMTFKQIEKVLGFPLVPSAYKERGWWSNGGGQANTWISRGWRTEQVSQSRQQLTFRRGRKARSRKR